MSRRLRVLSGHPQLGRPSDVRDGFDGAQAFVDAGLAEWVTEPDGSADEPRVRSEPVETTEQAPPPETAVTRPSPRRRGGR